MMPTADCALCPRLVVYREANRIAIPHGFNAPVPSFGPLTARLLVVGQAPGVNGANTTGRPFTGDVAGRLLYPTLIATGFAKGVFDERADDGLKMVDCRVTNAVRCAPPQHKLETSEIRNCRPFLAEEIAAMKKLQVFLSIGQKPHEEILRVFGLKTAAYKFAHGALHTLPNGLLLADSFHTSQYNVNTGRLTAAMFTEVVERIRALLA